LLFRHAAYDLGALRIVTWNVNSLRARLPRVLEFLAEFQPDVACLQETKVAPDTFPVAELAEAGYGAVHHSAGQWAGVALLARDGLTFSDPQLGLPGEPTPGEAIAGRVRELAGTPLLVAGDINIAPADLDVYDPAAFIGGTHVSVEERTRLEQILEAGLVDAYRHLHPDEQQFTWWDYRAGNFHKGLGLRIDLAMLSPDLAERLRTCGMIRDYRKGKKPSDHAPLLLELE
jgi:exodeoxyribonuclease-3